MLWSCEKCTILTPLSKNSFDETSVADRHRCHIAADFGAFVDEDQSKCPSLSWLPKLQSRFFANSCPCTTTDLSILLTFCPTAIKNYVLKYCTTVMKRMVKMYFGLLKIQVRFLKKLKVF